METRSSDDVALYRAFISYSHQDEKWASWLHKSLESYRPPKRLIGQATRYGPVPRRLTPVFRDRDELASATDLGQEIMAALQGSACQIVICSPAAARSHWVNEEILAYKRLGREDRVFCLIVAGEPNATDLPGREDEECFPNALRFCLGPDGELSGVRAEPIAADGREGKDGKSNARLKIIAGLLGVGFDALKQREQHRRQRRLVAITMSALTGMAFSTALATFAFLARVEADRQRVRAEAEAETAKQTTDFLIGLFEVSDPSQARGNSITAREILDQGSRRVRTELSGQPVVQARLMDTMGAVYRSLGLYPEAGELLQDALKRRRAALDMDNPETALTMAHLAEVLSLQARHREAEPLYVQALDAQRKLLGNQAPAVADTLVAFADLRTAEGQFEEAEVLLRESLEIRRQRFGAQSMEVSRSLENLGMSLYDQGKYPAAEALLRTATETRKVILKGAPHPEMADGLNNLGLVLMDVGDLAQAEARYREALAMNRILLDPLHPTIAVNLNNLALVLHDQGKFKAAEPLYREVLLNRRKALGDRHPEVARALNNLAFLLYDMNERTQALAMARDALAIFQQSFKGDHPDVANGMANVGGWLALEGDRTAALPLLVNALEMRRRLFEPPHAEIAISETALAHLYVDTGRYAEARVLAAQSGTMLAEVLPAAHWRIAWAESVEGAALARLGEHAAGEKLLLHALAALERADGSGSRRVYVRSTRGFLRELYRGWGKPGKAEAFARRGP